MLEIQAKKRRYCEARSNLFVFADCQAQTDCFVPRNDDTLWMELVVKFDD